MLLLSQIRDAYEGQQEELRKKNLGIPRQLIRSYEIGSHIEVITGVRRCGKSTLLKQIAEKTDAKYLYFNFEDSRVFGFQVSDFQKLLRVSVPDAHTFFFDEIQNVPGWEIFIRSLHDQKRKVFITGSNASLLSRELGTRLTGRYLNRELFPFSYREFLVLKGLSSSVEAFQQYLEKGGFPEYLEQESIEILQQLFKDILYRDIAVRYGIRNVKPLIEIALFLVSNIGKEYSLNRIRKIFGIGSANSVSDYVNWFEDSYLFFSVPRFSWSVRSVMVSPRKIYTIDTAFARSNSLSFLHDTDRLFENCVFLHLCRHGRAISYFRQKYECDFIVRQPAAPAMVLQACSDLNPDNKDREINGLLEAMDFINHREGFIVTLDQEDEFSAGDRKIRVVPAWKWLESF